MALELKVKSIIGFSGTVRGGLHYTPCGKYAIYPIGAMLVIKNMRTEKEAFLNGHSKEVSCISLSHDGRKIASGQVNFLGVKADVILWNLDEAKKLCDTGKSMIGDDCLLYRLHQHLSKVQDLAFSNNDLYICTLGGQDDKALVVWNVQTGTAVCGAAASTDATACCKWLNNRDDRIVTAGHQHLRVWQIDFRTPKMHPMDAKFGSLRRIIECVDISDDDHFAYCGTTTGDVLKVKIDRNDIRSPNDPDSICPVFVVASKERLAQGVGYIVNRGASVLIGGGDGTLAYINPTTMKMSADKRTQLMGSITSITLLPSGDRMLVGTDQCNRYEVSSDLAEATMRSSCHFGPVNDIAFPQGCSDLIVTSSVGDIRIWNIKQKKELLRVQLPNLECLCCCVTPTGSTILSGWNDGKIRAFLPESGRLKFVITDAHTERVTSLAVCGSDAQSPWRIISGGAEGRVRVWNVTSSHQTLLASLKEHRGSVNCLRINNEGDQCVSASADGSCIVWDLVRYVRLMAFFEPNVFCSVLYHPDGSQMLTCGSNHKITYWDATDGSAIRVIDGAEEALSSLDIDPTGEFFVSGADDKLVKIWHYDDGIPVAIGRGHSGVIKSVKISPDNKLVVSVGSMGEILFWEMPTTAALRNVC